MFPLCLALQQANAMASKRAAHDSSLMVNIFVRSPASSGAFLAVATTPLLLLLSKTKSEQFAAVLLAFIGAIYVGFGLQTGTRTRADCWPTAQFILRRSLKLGALLPPKTVASYACPGGPVSWRSGE
jgi:hypothetical protein